MQTRRWITCLLTAALLAGCTPLTTMSVLGAEATQDEGRAAEQPLAEEPSTGVTAEQPLEEAPVTEVTAEQTLGDEPVAEETAEQLLTEEPVTAETTEQQAGEEPADAEEPASDEQAPAIIEIFSEAETAEENLGLGDQDLLFEQYADRLFYGRTGASDAIGVKKAAKNRSASLDGQNLALYTALKTAAAEIANGERDSAVIEVPLEALGIRTGPEDGYTAEELGLDYIYDWETGTMHPEAFDRLRGLIDYDFALVRACLAADCPYEFYWASGPVSFYTSGGGAGSDGNTVYFVDETTPFKFEVETKYRSDVSDAYSVDTSRTGQAAGARDRAAQIIAGAEGRSDYEKLLYYKEQICGMVSYDFSAAADMYGYEDRGPWALIYVFDGDSETNVVCEGYSEAFQYLCDNTSFNSDKVRAYSVTGMMVGGTGEGPHKWNIVRMDDGWNYLVDITNSDEGSIGSDGKLFLKGVDGSVAEGYRRSWEERQETVEWPDGTVVTYTYPAGSILYTYDKETLSVYTESELTLSSKDYGENTAKEPRFRSHSLVLSGQIGVKFYMDLSTLTEAERADSYVEFRISGKGGVSSTDPYDPEDMNAAGTYYGFSYYASSIQMADTITAVYHYGDGLTVEKEYTVKRYLQQVHDQSTNEKMRALGDAIWDYGYYAQVYLDRIRSWTLGTDHEAMGAPMHTYTAEDLEAVKEDVSSYAMVKDLGNSQIEKVTYSLALDSETGINVYMQVQEGFSGPVTASIGSGTENVAELQPDGRYLVRISNISAHKLGDFYEIRGNAGGSFTIRVAALSYVRTTLNAATAKDDQKNAAAALYYYYKKTMEYRGQ